MGFRLCPTKTVEPLAWQRFLLRFPCDFTDSAESGGRADPLLQSLVKRRNVMRQLRLYRISHALLLGLTIQGYAQCGAREIALEDKIAEKVLQIRAAARLPRLSRIKNREELRGLTCIAAERDTSSAPWIYKTDDPLSSTELRKIALTLGVPNDGPPIVRFAIAVWPARNLGTSAKESFWVGIEGYMSAWWEFVNFTFTDDRSYKNTWKHELSAGCKNAR